MDRKTSYSDVQLIRLAQKGNKGAYNILLGRYYFKIQKTIFFYINDSFNVKDLTQEVLFKIYRYLEYFKEESQFSTWIYKITQNTIKNHFRSLSARLDFEEQYINEYLSASSISPEHLLIRMEFDEQIETALSKLSKELQICYGMHVFEGCTYEDIAKKINCPIGTVRSRIFRARKLLLGSIRKK